MSYPACGGERQALLATPPTVLIVDDSEVARRALANRLTAAGLDVVELDSARTGIGASLEGVTCAVLDLELGDGDGVEVAKALRSRDARLPIAFFTGAATSALAGRAKTYGPVFAKPDDLEAIATWVKTTTGP